MKHLTISAVKAKFDTYSDASRITFSTTSGEPVVWVKTRDIEGFITEGDMDGIDNLQISHCWDCVDDIFGESEEEWEACANRELQLFDVELGDYHDDGKYYDLRYI